MQSCIIIIHQATCAILTIGTIWYRILSFTLLILYIINLGHFHCYKVYTSENKLHNRILSGLSYIILIRQCHSEIKMVHYSNLVSINHCLVWRCQVMITSKSSWTGPPAYVGRPCWSSPPPHLPPSLTWPSSMFLNRITPLGSNLFSKLYKGSFKNEVTYKFSCHILELESLDLA